MTREPPIIGSLWIYQAYATSLVIGEMITDEEPVTLMLGISVMGRLRIGWTHVDVCKKHVAVTIIELGEDGTNDT